LNLGHIFREKSVSYEPRNTVVVVVVVVVVVKVAVTLLAI